MSHAQAIYLNFAVTGADREHRSKVLQAALRAGPVRSVLFSGDSIALDDLRPLIALAQTNDVAALVLNDTTLAKAVKADGVHIGWSEDVLRQTADVRKVLGPDAIVGTDAGRSRHDAMELGEAGADYVAFGIPPHVQDRERAAERQLDLVAWWSDLFELPCVAFNVEDSDQAAKLFRAGADFIALTIEGDSSPDEAAQRVRQYAEGIAEAGAMT